MELKHLEIFQKVSETKSFSRAAEIIFLSQPTITNHINNLEHSLGVRLFTRKGNIVDLTEAGKRFLQYTKQILSLADEAKSQMQFYSKGTQGTINIGATPTICNYLLPSILSAFHKHYPEVKIKLESVSSPNIIQMALNREIHLGLIRSNTESPGNSKLSWKTINTDNTILVASKESTLSRSNTLTMLELSKRPLITYGKDSVSWANIVSTFNSINLIPNVLMEIDDINTVKRMLVECNAMSFLPEISVREDIAEGNLIEINITDCLPYKRYILLIYRESLYTTEALQNFLSFLEKFKKNS